MHHRCFLGILTCGFLFLWCLWLQVHWFLLCVVESAVEAVYHIFCLKSLHSLAPEFLFVCVSVYDFSLFVELLILLSWFYWVVYVLFSLLSIFKTIILSSFSGSSISHFFWVPITQNLLCSFGSVTFLDFSCVL